MNYQSALITGASSGIGRRLAELLAGRGVHVVLCARRTELLDDLVQQITSTGGRAQAMSLDVADTDKVVRAIQKADDETGGLDLVIANAGVSQNYPATRMTWQRIEPMLRVNFLGAIATLTAVLPRMVERNRGHLVGVSSLAGLRALPAHAAYSATKAGFSTFLEGLRIDLHGTQVLVTTVQPGFVRTAMTEKNQFRMPFLLELNEACDLIMRGLDAEKRTIDFPAPMALLAHSAAVLPASLYEVMMSRQRITGHKYNPLPTPIQRMWPSL